MQLTGQHFQGNLGGMLQLRVWGRPALKRSPFFLPGVDRTQVFIEPHLLPVALTTFFARRLLKLDQGTLGMSDPSRLDCYQSTNSKTHQTK